MPPASPVAPSAGCPIDLNWPNGLAGQSENDLKVVECTDAKAEHKVVGKVEDKTQAQFTEDVCSAYPTTESAYWWGKKGGNGDVLCLEPIKK